MSVKPRDVPPLLCFNMKTGVRFLLQQLLFDSACPVDTEAVVKKYHATLYLKVLESVAIPSRCDVGT